MSWLLRNLAEAWLLPPLSLAVVQVIALLAWPRARARWLLAAPSLLLLLFSLPIAATALVRPLENRSPALDLRDPALAARADAIVVLGAGREFNSPEYGGDSPTAEGLERLRYASHLWKATRRPILITGGAPDRPGPAEARLMREVMATDFSVPVQWTEERSANTAENAAMSFAILAPLGIRRIFLVTHGWHMPRASLLFRRAGFEVIAAPTGFETDVRASSPLAWVPSARAFWTSAHAFHEYLGIAWYRLHP